MPRAQGTTQASRTSASVRASFFPWAFFFSSAVSHARFLELAGVRKTTLRSASLASSAAASCAPGRQQLSAGPPLAY